MSTPKTYENPTPPLADAAGSAPVTVWRCDNFDEPTWHLYATSLDGGLICCCGGLVHKVPNAPAQRPPATDV